MICFSQFKTHFPHTRSFECCKSDTIRDNTDRIRQIFIRKIDAVAFVFVMRHVVCFVRNLLERGLKALNAVRFLIQVRNWHVFTFYSQAEALEILYAGTKPGASLHRSPGGEKRRKRKR